MGGVFFVACGASDTATVAPMEHTFPEVAASPDGDQCISWSLNNEEPIVVDTVDLVLGKGWKSASWFYVVKGDKDTQPDGVWKCSKHGFTAEAALKRGAVLFEITEPPPEGRQQFKLPDILAIPEGSMIVAQVRASTKTTATITLHADTVGTVHDGTYWMPEQSSVMARDVDMLFYGILGLCIFFFVAITAAVIILVYKYRHRPGHQPEPSPAHNDALEITWTVIPSIIVVIIFVLGWKGYINLATPPRHALEVKVQGQKWVWNFTHTTDGGDSVQDKVLHVPVNRQVSIGYGIGRCNS